MKHAVPDYPDHPQASGSHGEDIPYMSNRLKHVTEDEAIDYLNICKAAYTKAVNETSGPYFISQYRLEIRYWEDYIAANWPEERPKRDPFGGKAEPMTKEQLTEAMDQVYERLGKVHEIQGFGLSAESRTIAEVYGSLKTLCAVVDELIKKLE